MNVKKLLSAILAVVMLFSLGTSALAVESLNNNIDQVSIQQIEVIKNDVLEVSSHLTEDYNYVQTVENVDVLRDELKKIHPQISDYELGKSILLALGDSEEFIASLPEEKVVEAVQYTSVVIDEVYLHELSSGEMVPISKERFYEPDVVHSAKVYAYYGVSSQNDITAQVSYAHAILAWSPSFSVNSKGAVSFGGVSAQRQVFNGDAFTLYYE